MQPTLRLAYFAGHVMKVLVRSLNAKFEPDRDKADKSAKLCIQFPWDMSMKSEMGALEKKFPVTV